MALSDPMDKILHVAVAAVIVGSVIVSGVWGIAIVNSVLWPLREAVQRHNKGKDWWRFSADNHFEAWPPGIAGFLLAYVA